MLKLVRANCKDADTLARISKHAFDNDIHYGAPGPGGPPGYDSKDWQGRAIRMAHYYRIDRDGETIGGLIVFEKAPREYELVRIFLAPDCQNQGLGKQVCQALWALYPLAKRWTLDTPSWNARTRHFYEMQGFREYGQDEHGLVLFERSIEPAQP